MSKNAYRPEEDRPISSTPKNKKTPGPLETDRVETITPSRDRDTNKATATRNQVSSPKPKVRQPASGEKTGARSRRKGIPVWVFVIVIGAVIWAVIAFFLLSGGKSEPKPVAFLNTLDVHSLSFNPVRPDVVFFGSHNGLLKSQDNGLSWQPTNLSNLDAMGIGQVGDGKTIYISGHEVFSRSDDGGVSWRSLLEQLGGATDVHALAVDPANQARLYIFAVGTGLLKSEDRGQSWQTISNQLGNGLGSLAFGNNTLWAAVSGRGVLRSQDGGVSWQAASGYANAALDANNKVTTLAFNPTSNILYAGTLNGLYQSSDGGGSWNRLAYGEAVAALAVNPVNSKNILLVNLRGEVFRSQDGGITWPGN